MTRLAPVLDSAARHGLLRTLAERVVRAGLDAGLDVVVVTSDHEVRAWAESLGVDVREDPGEGLDTAVGSATSLIDGPWIVAHADLPMVNATALRHVAELARTGRTVLVPSLDGGTTIVGSTGAFPFSYGPGSFHRHLAAAPTAVVAPSAVLSVDIDTSAQLIALRDALDVPSLAE
jgi:2-phospho-L-lactate guanylyltransferase